MDEVDHGNNSDISYLKETVGPLNIPKSLLADILSDGYLRSVGIYDELFVSGSSTLGQPYAYVASALGISNS